MNSELPNSEFPGADSLPTTGLHPHQLASSDPELSPQATQADGLMTDQFQPLDPNSIQADMISSLVFTCVIAVVAVAADVTAWFNVGFTTVFWCIAGGGLAFVALLAILAVLWPRWDYQRTSYRVDEMGLEIRRGVIWRHQLSVPIGRVQHADVSQGPLQRMFGIATLTVHTAGTQNSSVALEGLSHDLAIQLRDLIVHQRGEYDAV